MNVVEETQERCPRCGGTGKQSESNTCGYSVCTLCWGAQFIVTKRVIRHAESAQGGEA